MESDNLRTEADILARQSRPQRHSTWTPSTRDWRHEAGVIQHDDYDDAPKSRSVWDNLDYDYQKQVGKSPAPRSPTASAAGHGLDGTTETDHTPLSKSPKNSLEPVQKSSPINRASKPMVIPKGLWRQVTKLTSNNEAAEGDEEPEYEVTGLIVRLRFTGKNKASLKVLLEQPQRAHETPDPIMHQKTTPPASAPNTPATARTAETIHTPHKLARTAETIHTPHKLESLESLHRFPLFKREWVDETQDFNMQAVRKKLRHPGIVVEELGANYHWYTDAVSAEAMFPPGVPLSAKEIHAFYPHHVRWKGVAVRLANNNYRGADMLGMQAHFRGQPDHHMTAAHMNNYQRDAVKTALPGFKTASYTGKGDKNLRTDSLAPGPYIESMRKGLVLPTFEDLVRGLQRLPSGLDARGLTQCLSWYLNIRDTFTPKLAVNVLHTQSLIRALRQPLKPFGPQNLDRNALEEFRDKGTVESVEIENNAQFPGGSVPNMLALERSRMHLNLDNDSVSMDVTVPVRHVLILPFIALQKVVEEALRFGIDKAENRQEARTGDAAQKALEAKFAASAAAQVDEEMDDEPEPDQGRWQTPAPIPEQPAPDRIPKRPLPVKAGSLSVHKKPKPDSIQNQPPVASWPTAAPTGLLAQPPAGPRSMMSSHSSIAPRPAASNSPFYLNQPPIYQNPTWRATAPAPSTSVPSRAPAVNMYGNQLNQARLPQGQYPTHQAGLSAPGGTSGDGAQGHLPQPYGQQGYANVDNRRYRTLAPSNSSEPRFDQYGREIWRPRGNAGVEYDQYGNVLRRL